METTHRVVHGDSRNMDAVPDDSVELVVTSPPYPMIEMWDDAFTDLDPAVGDALENGDGDRAFERMHTVLDETWGEVERVLVDGGIVCVNVGDATRSIDGSFELWPNHVHVTEWFRDHGFQSLPDIVWRKPTNSPTKFLGSGTLPPNAYVTLEHEHILVFRNGDRRSFQAGSERRYESAFFWEERNRWFTDLWEHVTGEAQTLEDPEIRRRSGAFPFEIPYRLVNMYSVYGDTVLDPFLGTGTTSLAAMVGARNSVGYEVNEDFAAVLGTRVDDAPAMARSVIARRLENHTRFVEEYEREHGEMGYTADHLGVPVRTKQEHGIQFYAIENVDRDTQQYVASHKPIDTAELAGGMNRIQ